MRISEWSSDVCCTDLGRGGGLAGLTVGGDDRFADVTRQINGDGGALAGRRGDRDLAVRLAQEADALDEAEPGRLADRLDGEKRIEHTLEHHALHAAAPFGHSYADILPGGPHVSVPR